MKITKKVSLLLSMLLFVICFGETVLAEGQCNGTSENPPSVPSVIIPYGTDSPDKSNCYPNQTWVDLEGYANISTLYSNCCFKGVYRITLWITNNSSSELNVSLRQYNVGYGHSNVSSETVAPKTTTTIYFTGLQSDKYYFLQFSAPSDFNAKALGIVE